MFSAELEHNDSIPTLRPSSTHAVKKDRISSRGSGLSFFDGIKDNQEDGMDLVLYKGRHTVFLYTSVDGIRVMASKDGYLSGVRMQELDSDPQEIPSDEPDELIWFVETTIEGLRVTKGPGSPYDWKVGEPVSDELPDELRRFLPHLLGIAGLEEDFE